MPSLEELVGKVTSMAEKSQEQRLKNYDTERDDKLWAEKLKRIEDLNKMKEASSLAKDNTDRLIAADDKRTTREEAKLDTQLKIAEMRWGPDGALGGAGTGGGGSSRGGKSAETMAHEAALKIMDRTALPGQQPVSYQKAMTEARQAFVAPPPAPGTETVTTGTAQVPALPQNQLSEARWKQYGDKKGMSYQGLQPGIQDDQIARFARSDGVAHFANTGAAINALAGVPRPSANAQIMRSGPGPAIVETQDKAAVAGMLGRAHKASPEAQKQPVLNEALGKLSTWLGNRPENPQNFSDTYPEQTYPTTAPAMAPIAKGAREWLASWNKKKTSTNPLFPNYEQ